MLQAFELSAQLWHCMPACDFSLLLLTLDGARGFVLVNSVVVLTKTVAKLAGALRRNRPASSLPLSSLFCSPLLSLSTRHRAGGFGARVLRSGAS